MNILYCGDKNVEKGVWMSVLSLLNTSTSENEKLHIYIMTVSLEANGKTYLPVTDEFVTALEAFMKSRGEGHSVKKIDATASFLENKPEINLGTRFTPCCMLRLFSDLYDLPEKLLYLDNDVIARKDIREFYSMNIDAYEYAGVRDFYGQWFYGNRLTHNYVNSGVLLMNMKKIKETGLFQKCRDRCRTVKMFLPDQHALNKLAVSKKIVSRKYNEQRKLHKNTVMQHFTTTFRLFPKFHSVTAKPWNMDKVHELLHLHEYDSLYEQYKETYYRKEDIGVLR